MKDKIVGVMFLLLVVAAAVNMYITYIHELPVNRVIWDWVNPITVGFAAYSMAELLAIERGFRDNLFLAAFTFLAVGFLFNMQPYMSFDPLWVVLDLVLIVVFALRGIGKLRGNAPADLAG